MTVNLPAPPYSYETGKTSASVNWKKGAGNGRHITGITIHHWGSSKGLSFDGIVDFLCSPRPANPTSAHYVAQGADANGTKKPRVACIVDPDDIAYACGNWNGNLTQISIECRPNCYPADLEVVAQLIARLRNQYGPLPLYPHSHWTATECPGDDYRAQLAWLDKRANAILAGASKPAPTPTPAPVPAAGAATKVVAAVSPSRITAHDKVTVSATVSPVVPGVFRFDWSRPGANSWTPFGGDQTSSSGRASVVSTPGADVVYRARFYPTDAKKYAADWSPNVAVDVVTLADYDAAQKTIADLRAQLAAKP